MSPPNRPVGESPGAPRDRRPSSTPVRSGALAHRAEGRRLKPVEVSSDRSRIDRVLVHAFLTRHTRWARGIDRARVDRAIDASLCFGAFVDGAQIGFARVITDGVTFAYLCDVFVLPAWRGAGAARALLAAIDAHDQLQGLRRFLLFTTDAHGLYGRFGFTPLRHPERGMERLRTDLYTSTDVTRETCP
jgi:GNAT superfamily N-acetyltransferase